MRERTAIAIVSAGSVIAFAALAAAFTVFLPAPAEATVMGVYPGDLIKLADDHDPATAEDEVVYYFDKDWYRHPFPNRRVYMSWYEDFSGIKEVTREEMAEIRLGGNVVYRPGTRLVKIPSVPKVYAVEPSGVLRWIETEAVAKGLYGDDWAERVDDVQESFFVNYREGAPLTAPVWPTGTFLRRASDTALFVIDGAQKRHVSPLAAAGLRAFDANVIVTASDLSEYADGTPVASAEWKLVDTAQLSYVDTQSPPIVDFPVDARSLSDGEGRTLAAFRVSAGAPIIIKRISVTIEGPLWSGSAPNFEDIAFVDVAGENLFGTKQLESQPGAASETLTFDGAYTLQPNTVSVVDLKADAAGLPEGATVTVSLDRASFLVYDSASGQLIPDFHPREGFPEFTLEVE
jgi:hypothetical protein